MFDWANSAYSLVISTAVFPPFYASIAPDKVNFLGTSVDSNSLYSYALSFAFLIVAVMIPMLSGIADYSGRRKMFLQLFTIIGSISCMALFFFKDGADVYLGIFGFVLGTIGFGACLVFYNAYLPEIATEDRYDDVSAKGYAYGYVGSVILLVIILLMISFYDKIGLPDKSLAIRIGFLLVGLWWFLFSLITFKSLPEDKKNKIDGSLVKKGIDELRQVARIIYRQKYTMRFLLSYFFFIAGVNVVIYLASIFAKEELGFSSSNLIVLILILQFLATVGAYFFAWLSDKKGNKFSLMVQVVIWIFICFFAYLTKQASHFYILSVFVGLVFGGIQSLSRSSYSKFIFDESVPLTSYYSFYDVLTKLAIVSGSVIFGVVNQITGSMRNSILSLTFLFIIGLIILATVKFDKSLDESVVN